MAKDNPRLSGALDKLAIAAFVAAVLALLLL